MNVALHRREAVGRSLRLAVMTALWCCTAVASAATVDFQGLGKVVPTGLPDPEGNLPLQVLARSSDYSFGGARRWRLESRFVSNIVTGVGSGVFRFYSGNDDLSGSVTMLLIPGTEFGAFDTSYTVEGGSGRLVGFSGLGRSTVTLLGPQTKPPTPFEEAGQLSITRHDAASDRKLLMELGILR
jgi:hypothetical protein